MTNKVERPDYFLGQKSFFQKVAKCLKTQKTFVIINLLISLVNNKHKGTF